MVDTVHEAVTTLAQQSTDPAARGIAALSARLSYAFMCLALCWGVLTATGWVRSVTGRRALRSGHLMLSTLALAFGCLHALGFLYLTVDPFSLAYLSIPFMPGTLARHTFGIVGLELMLAIALTTCVQRWTSYRRWLWLHRLAYPAVALTALHAFLGAIANGHLAAMWLVGITLLVPPVTLALLRFLPPRTLERIGLVEEHVA